MEELLIGALLSALEKETFSGFGTFLVLAMMFKKLRVMEKAHQKRFDSINRKLANIDKKVELNRKSLEGVVYCPYLKGMFDNADPGDQEFS